MIRLADLPIIAEHFDPESSLRQPTGNSFAATIAGLCALVCVLWSGSAWAVDDPNLEFETIVTPHFRVHYHSGLEHVAKRTAKVAEEAHAVLTPRLEWVPAKRTHVVVTDRADSANGSARVFGRNVINVFAMPPESESVLGFYDDWLRVLVYHEYVHILHLDTIGGISPYINAVIGKLVVPNQTLPRWYIEGLATYYESATSRGGRVKSSLFQTYLRAAALDGDLFELGTASNSPTEWPFGTTSYLYGGFFLDYIIQNEGEEFAAKFNRGYGSRIIPWRINGIANEISGKTMERYWDEWTAAQTAKAQAERLIVQARGRTSVELLTSEGGRSGGAVIDPKTSQVTFYHFDFMEQGAYSNYDPATGKITRLLELEGAEERGSWDAAGENFYFGRRGVVENVYSYFDVWVWNRERDSLRQVTRGERAREPAISPDGKWLAYVRTVPGSAELVVRRVEYANTARVVAGAGRHAPDQDAHWQQVATPAWSPDGKRLVFSRWRLDEERRDLFVWDRTTGKTTRLTDDFALEFDPSFISNDEVIFSGDRGGTFNIYSIKLSSGVVKQLTRVVRGVFDPVMAPGGDGLYVSSYTDDGFELGRLEGASLLAETPEAGPVAALPPIEPPIVEFETSEPEEYEALRWIAPQYILPDFGVVQSGAGFGLELAGSDLVGHHSWVLAAGFLSGRDITEQRASVGASYSYYGSVLDVSLVGRYRQYPRLSAYFAGSDFVTFKEEESLAQLGLTYPLRSVSDSISLSAYGRAERTRFADGRPEIVLDPFDLEPRDPEQGWFNEIGFAVNYGNLDGFPRSISVEKGVSGRAGISVQDPAIGSEFKAVTFNWNADFYWPAPFFDRHVLAWQNAGGVTATESVNPQRFFVGGTRPQDVLTSVIFQSPTGGRQLRGHPPAVASGRSYVVSSAQYRFPIWDADIGFGTLPVYLRRVKGVAFADAGTATDGYLRDADQFLVGTGGEVLVEMVFGYYLRGNLRLGYARGLDAFGTSEGYLLYGGGF